MTPPSHGRSWEVHISRMVAQSLLKLQDQASGEGRGESLIVAFGAIIDQLRRAPTVCGEPSYQLPVLRMQVRRVSLRPLIVHFAVCEDRPLVFIRAVSLLCV